MIVAKRPTYTEERIYIGDPLYVLGPFQSKTVALAEDRQEEDDTARKQLDAAEAEEGDWKAGVQWGAAGEQK